MQILDQTNGDGTDKGVDAVGYQAHGTGGEEQPALVLNSLVEIVRATGRIGVVGLYLPKDPGAPDEHSANGELLFKVGKFFEKGQRMGTGQANVKAYNRQLRDLIIAGRARPSFVVEQEAAAGRRTGRLRPVRPPGGRLLQGRTETSRLSRRADPYLRRRSDSCPH